MNPAGVSSKGRQRLAVVLRLAEVLCLTAASYLGNVYAVSVLFGVQFTFGSIASLIAMARFGWPTAMIVAILGASYTIKLWDHPYVMVIAALEVLFVAQVSRRFQGHILIAAVLYWLFPGAVLIALVNGVLLKFGWEAATFIWLKQCVNGIFNAMIASSLLLAFDLWRGSASQIPFHRVCFNVLVTSAFAPALIFMMAASHKKMEAVKSLIENDTKDQAEEISQHLAEWRKLNLGAVKALAEALHPPLTAAELQQKISLVHAAHPNFADMYVADAQARTVGFDPSVDAQGRSLLGLSFSDRPYYHEVKATKNPLVADMVIGRGLLEVPIVCFVAPVLGDGQNFEGYALGAFDVRELGKLFDFRYSKRPYRITLTDRQGQVVISSVPGIQPLDVFQQRMLGATIEQISPSTYWALDPQEGSSSFNRWRSTWFGVLQDLPFLGWTLHVESPLRPYIDNAQAWYIEAFGQLLVVTLVAMHSSYFLIHWFSRPIAQLASTTTAIARQSRDGFAWPQSRFAEIATLVGNFKAMAATLQQRFGELTREVKERKDAEGRLKLAMEEAQAANEAKSSFLANMSHEIRTPLSVIIGHAQLLGASQLAQRYPGIDAIVRNGQQLARLIDDILDLSKIEAGHLRFDPDWLTLDDLVAGGIEVQAQRAQDKGLALEVEGQGPFPGRLHVDPLRLRQILINVVGNAIKFTERGRVKITLAVTADSTEKARLHVRVLDTGIGIDPRQELFQPFVQADSSSARRYGGTGLGLALSWSIAHALGGRLDLVWSVPGQGSLFELEVPVGVPPHEEWHEDLLAARRASGAKTVQSSAPEQLDGYRLLVVEDTPDNLVLICQMLERYGAQVEGVASGKEGIAKALHEPWDLILMDMQMPVVDGYQATRSLRAQGYSGPIVALTAHAMPEERARCLQAGCDDHVAKPIEWVRLIGVIKDLVTHARAARPS